MKRYVGEQVRLLGSTKTRVVGVVIGLHYPPNVTMQVRVEWDDGGRRKDWYYAHELTHVGTYPLTVFDLGT